MGMEPLTIVTAAISFLTPFIKTLGDTAAQKAGERLFEQLANRFKDDPQIQDTLSDTRHDSSRIAELEQLLIHQVQADANFHQWLVDRLDEHGGVTSEAHNNTQAISVGGDVGRDVITAERDVHIHYHKNESPAIPNPGSSVPEDSATPLFSRIEGVSLRQFRRRFTEVER